MKELRHSSKSKGNGRRRKNEVRDKEDRYGWFSLIVVLQAEIKDPVRLVLSQATDTS
jgi:hypothetical protein